MASPVRKEKPLKQVALAKVKDDLSQYLRDAGKKPIVITKHGRVAGLLIGFDSEDDWFDYQLEDDPRFVARIEAARESTRDGRGIRLEELDKHCSVGNSPACGRLRRCIPIGERRDRSFRVRVGG